MKTESLTLSEAREVCHTFRRKAIGGSGRTPSQHRGLGAEVRVTGTERFATTDANGRTTWGTRPAVSIVFTGGRFGEASLDLYATSLERLAAHWAGYCSANDWLAPAVGDLVVFPSASSPTGTRVGRVAKVGPRRAVIAYTFKHGGATTTTLGFDRLAWNPS